MSTNPILGPISGYTNYSVEESQAFHIMKQKVTRAYEQHGFVAFYPRPVERLCNLLLKGGIGNQIYQMATRDGQFIECGLPFDRTVSLALFVGERAQSIIYPFKRFDISYSFRGEHATTGRFRGFFQADIDIIDKSLSIDAEVECISTIYDSLKKIEIGDFYICVNHIQLTKQILSMLKVSDEKIGDVLHIIDKMPKCEEEETEKNLRETLPQEIHSSIPTLISIFSPTKSIANFRQMLLSLFPEQNLEDLPKVNQLLMELDTLMNQLSANGVDLTQLKFNPQMVRGLDYYTGIVFETFLTGLEKYGSIASGGRYSNLVETFSKSVQGIEGTGGAIGLTRLFEICTKEERLPVQSHTLSHAMIVARISELKVHANEIATVLRRLGYNVDNFTGSKTVKKQLDYANRKKIDFCIMAMAENSFVVKNLITKKQTDYSTIEEAVNGFQELLPPPIL